MPSRRRPAAILATILAAILATFTAAASAGPAKGTRTSWNTVVTLTPTGSHVLGNPQAKVKVTEYVSYTCSHCAHFAVESEAPLRQAYIPGGKVSIEVKHLLRDPIDLAAALLANCGPKDRFFANHLALMRSQPQWIQPLVKPTEAQRARWSSGDKVARLRAISGDFHLYEMLEARGYTRPQLDQCLADEALARRIAAQGADAQKLGIDSTPSFAINGTLLAGTHDWATLEPQIKVQM